MIGVLKICDELEKAKAKVVPSGKISSGEHDKEIYSTTPILTSSFWLGSIRAKTRTQFICGQMRLSASTTAAMIYNFKKAQR